MEQAFNSMKKHWHRHLSRMRKVLYCRLLLLNESSNDKSVRSGMLTLQPSRVSMNLCHIKISFR